jgi:hypothetical protein
MYVFVHSTIYIYWLRISNNVYKKLALSLKFTPSLKKYMTLFIFKKNFDHSFYSKKLMSCHLFFL